MVATLITEEALSNVLSFLFQPSISLGLGIAVVFLCVVLWSYEKRGNFPPGPKGLPIVGYLPFLTHEPQKDLEKLAKKYGDVVSFRIPGHNVVAFNSFDTIREAFVKQGDNVTGLPHHFTMTKWVLNYAGLEGTDGIIWKEQRRFMLQKLRDFGFGKTNLEGHIQECNEEVIEDILTHANQPYDLSTSLSNCTSNVVTKLFFNKTYGVNDNSFSLLMESSGSILQTMPGIEASRPLALIGKYIPFKFIPKYRNLSALKNSVYEILENIIVEHEKSFDADNLRDFVDVYLDRMQKAAPGSLDAEIFARDKLAPLCLNMLVGGIGTTSDSVNWAIKLLCLNPHVQEKVQKEIDDVFGRDRFPSYVENQKTPYTNATFYEVMRIASMFPVTEYLRTLEDTTIAGYRIPKETLLLANLYGVHRDPKLWTHPEEFNPENFIESDGKSKKDALVAFFVGKRKCPGEILAKVHFYLLLVMLLQKFTFRLADGEPRNLATNKGATRTLLPFKVVACPRT